MKLPDFNDDNGLNNLRAIIGANVNYNYNPYSSWDPLVIKLVNEGELGNLKLSDVTVSLDGTLEYGGIKIVVYIRDQNEKGFEKGYKFHFYNCQTIETFKKEGKYDGKYVVNLKGKFKVNIIDFGIIKKENLELDLKVCKNCLNGFNYKGYKNIIYNKKENIYSNFTREEYFESFKSKVTIPKYNDLTKPKDVYSDNWNEISIKSKERAKYRCEECGLDCILRKTGLHVHHKDHNKGNNSPDNLAVLCYNCHINHHSHMKVLQK